MKNARRIEMSEYIKREAVEKAIDSVYTDLYPDYVPNSIAAFRECLMVDIGIIPAADVEPVDRWISVKDKLPDEMQDKSIYSGWSEEIRPSESVLILTTGGSYDVAWYSYAFNDWTTDNETKSYEDWEVAYWQPLPKTPKEN